MIQFASKQGTNHGIMTRLATGSLDVIEIIHKITSFLNATIIPLDLLSNGAYAFVQKNRFDLFYTTRSKKTTTSYMKIQHSVFVSSSTSYKNCAHHTHPEIVFIGRSNVGKSSLINALLERKQLAKVSKTPGKTALINHFLVNNGIHFVDLPGYGWAQVSHATKIKWEKMVRDYLLYRTQIKTVFLLLDSKIPSQKIDLDFMDWLSAHRIPFAIILTKADKKNTMRSQKNYCTLMHNFMENWTTSPSVFFASAYDKLGLQDILSYIEKVIATT